MERRRIVHVVATGTIGEPLKELLASFRKELGIDEVTFSTNARRYAPTSRKVLALQDKGAKSRSMRLR